jgi:hypothetical protein
LSAVLYNKKGRYIEGKKAKKEIIDILKPYIKRKRYKNTSVK